MRAIARYGKIERSRGLRPCCGMQSNRKNQVKSGRTVFSMMARIGNLAGLGLPTCTTVSSRRFPDSAAMGRPCLEVITFPTKPGLDDITAEDLALPVEAPDHASPFRYLEDEICELTLMVDIASGLASELLNSPTSARGRSSDFHCAAARQHDRRIQEATFKKRYHERWNGYADTPKYRSRGTIHGPILMRFCMLWTSGR